MNINLRTALAAIALVSTAPASASLFTYSFTAGGDGVSSYGETYAYSCDGNFNYCTNNTVADSQSFTLNGSFTVDTSKLSADTFSGPDGLNYDSYPNQDPAAQFLSGSITKSGGSLPLATGTGGVRSYLYGYDNSVGGGGSFLQAYAQGPGSTFDYINEYRADGSLERRYYRDNYITFYIYNSLPDLGSLDGHDVATAFATAIGEGYAQIGFNMYEYLYDQLGNVSGYTQTQSYAGARITSLSAAPGGPASEVPEPAMLGLFGLGIAGLAVGRRRKAA